MPDCTGARDVLLGRSVLAQCDDGTAYGVTQCQNTGTGAITYEDIDYCESGGDGAAPDYFCSTSYGVCPSGTKVVVARYPLPIPA